MIEPKFKIGQELFLRNDIVNLKRETKEYRKIKPTVFLPIAILIEICPGGTQIHYQIRMYGGGGTITQIININEVELTDSEE